MPWSCSRYRSEPSPSLRPSPCLASRDRAAGLWLTTTQACLSAPPWDDRRPQRSPQSGTATRQWGVWAVLCASGPLLGIGIAEFAEDLQQLGPGLQRVAVAMLVRLDGGPQIL